MNPSFQTPGSGSQEASPGAAQTDDDSALGHQSGLPGATLPKGGGAIRGMGEKFDVNPVTGTASMSIPIVTSPGRDGFAPALSLSYDSGNGNGPFGFGWSLALDAISRKTSKGLPRYRHVIEEDTFVFSGAEDLVPVLLDGGKRYEDRESVPGYIIHRYRPRIEGTFRRVERWTNTAKFADVHWRVYTPDDLLTIYGRDENSRIFNPDAPEQIFSWLLSDSRDWNGNAMVFQYKAENGDGIDTSQEHQKTRGSRSDKRRSSNRYIKSIKYGNLESFLAADGKRIVFPTTSLLENAGWMFETVFDYGEHSLLTPTPDEEFQWPHRKDAFSRYRSGFEVRTARLCQRVLMFHHFPEETDVGQNCLTHSTALIYQALDPGDRDSAYTFLRAVEQSGYRRNSHESSGYTKRSLPKIEFQYTRPTIEDELKDIDIKALENLPAGISTRDTQWVDLYGEGVAGILTRVAGAWYYKRNISPINKITWRDGTSKTTPMFERLEEVEALPNVIDDEGIVFLDQEGDGFLSIMASNGSLGHYKQDENDGWNIWQPFDSGFSGDLTRETIYFADFIGGGLADAVVTDQSAWFASLGKQGFSAPEELSIGPGMADNFIQLLQYNNFAQRHFAFADMTGDGLPDALLIESGQVTFKPNLGYGRFGPTITMDNCPAFDDDAVFDARQVVLADIDGSGTTDLIYLHRDGATVYFNQSGNGWSSGHTLISTKGLMRFLDIRAVDILGNGTTCLLVSSPLPGTEPAMRYVDLMGSVKPHLLSRVENNMGSETTITYSTSTSFYLQDKKAGKPWISRLPFPISVVESYQIHDHISRNVFVKRFAYRHGHYDGEEREFRGFGLVEEWDTERLSPISTLPDGTLNWDKKHVLPASHSKSWFHLGLSMREEAVSRAYEKEYFQHPASWTLPDTVLPGNIDVLEERDAIRSLKGRSLRTEVFIDDATDQSDSAATARALRPMSVSESNYSVSRIQPASSLDNAVFHVTPREIVTFHYERDVNDPRVSHQIILQTNEYGQTTREVAIGYGRVLEDPALPTQEDRDAQTKTHVTYTESLVTNSITSALFPHSYRLPVIAETRNYELTGFSDDQGPQNPFTLDHFVRDNFKLLRDAEEIGYEKVPDTSKRQMRILQVLRTLYRADDLTALLPLGTMGPACIPGRTYELAFTPSMLDMAYQSQGSALLPSMGTLLARRDANGGGYYTTSEMRSKGLFPDHDTYDGYWLAGSLMFYSLSNNPAIETQEAHQRFYRPVRSQVPLGVETLLKYDSYSLLVLEMLNSAGNRTTVGERDSSGNLTLNGNDYRTLSARLVTDENGNRRAVIFDALGAVSGEAIMGKRGEPVGDHLIGFDPDPPELTVLQHIQNPTGSPKRLLQGASARTVSDLFAYERTKHTDNPQPPVSYTISRTSHEAELETGELPEMHHGFSYSDGFGRIIQSKLQTKPGPVCKRGQDGRILLDEEGQPILTNEKADPRWISSGWVIYNNKGKPVASYEPFFTHLTEFEFDVRAGVAPIAFYDALGRAVATLDPNGSFVKKIFTPWRGETWDNNDTALLDPRQDGDVKQYASPYFADKPGFQTWFQRRINQPVGDKERQAAEKTRAHAGTPSVTFLDSLGRVFLTAGMNKVECEDHELDGQNWIQYTRVEYDIEGHGLAVRDANIDDLSARGRVTATFQYDMAGRVMVQSGIDTGKQVELLNAQNQPMYKWNDRGHRIGFTYDRSTRHLYSSVLGDSDAPGGPESEVVFYYIVYGEHHPRASDLNLKGRVYMTMDQAGISVNDRRDFKNNLVEASKKFNVVYKETVDWSALKSVIPIDMSSSAHLDPDDLDAVLAEHVDPETFQGSAAFDAQDRLVSITSPNSDGKPSTTHFTYVIDCLTEVYGTIRSETDPTTGKLVVKDFVRDLNYDAHGLRSHITYGNGVTTKYEYTNTGDLTRLLSTRELRAGLTEVIQDLNYTYNPGRLHMNITDRAQQDIFFRNNLVRSTSDFTYDALYQLIRATGREHLGQPGGSPIPYGPSDSARSGLQPGDGTAMGTFAEDYVYDRTGNMKQMKHAISDSNAPGHTWTRLFTHLEPSKLDPASLGNRLSSSTVSNSTETYSYDEAGNTTRMPHLTPGGGQNMFNDFENRLRRVDLGGGGMAYYVYDMSGQRVRKIVERGPNLKEERLYLGATMEIFRRHQSGQVRLERETFHVGDLHNRIAMVETRVIDLANNDRAPPQVQRFQLCNHSRSTSVELDQDGLVLTYEEYSPYGTTTYAGTESTLELPKRYRLSGKERDVETGLSYFGARYYAPWTARWTRGDPSGGFDGLNVYQYCLSNPISFLDPDGADPASTSVIDSSKDWLKHIVKGWDAQDHVFNNTKGAKESEVVLGKWEKVKGALGFKVTKRLDIVTEHGAVQVKWIDHNGANVEQRILKGLEDAQNEVEKIKNYLKQTSQKNGWVNDRVTRMWKEIPKGEQPKHTLKFVIDGDAKAIEKFRETAQRVIGNKHTFDVVEGTYTPWRTVLARRMAKAAAKNAVVVGAGFAIGRLSKFLPGVGVASSLHELATADSWGEKAAAGVELVGSVLEMTPLAPVGAVINGLMGLGRLGYAGYQALKELEKPPEPKEPEKAAEPEPVGQPETEPEPEPDPVEMSILC